MEAIVRTYYNRNPIKAVMRLFPEFGLDESKFATKSHGSHHKIPSQQIFANQRRIFESYAKINGFNPTIASNWYSLTTRQINKFKVGSGLCFTINICD